MPRYPLAKLPNWPRRIVSHLLLSVQLFQNISTPLAPSHQSEKLNRSTSFVSRNRLNFPINNLPNAQRQRERDAGPCWTFTQKSPTDPVSTIATKTEKWTSFELFLSSIQSWKLKLFHPGGSTPGWLNANCYLLVSLVKGPSSLNRILSKVFSRMRNWSSVGLSDCG